MVFLIKTNEWILHQVLMNEHFFVWGGGSLLKNPFKKFQLGRCCKQGAVKRTMSCLDILYPKQEL